MIFSNPQEKRVDKATLEMEPEYPAKYFDELATDLCTSKSSRGVMEVESLCSLDARCEDLWTCLALISRVEMMSALVGVK